MFARVISRLSGVKTNTHFSPIAKFQFSRWMSDRPASSSSFITIHLLSKPESLQRQDKVLWLEENALLKEMTAIASDNAELKLMQEKRIKSQSSLAVDHTVSPNAGLIMEITVAGFLSQYRQFCLEKHIKALQARIKNENPDTDENKITAALSDRLDSFAERLETAESKATFDACIQALIAAQLKPRRNDLFQSSELEIEFMELVKFQKSLDLSYARDVKFLSEQPHFAEYNAICDKLRRAVDLDIARIKPLLEKQEHNYALNVARIKNMDLETHARRQKLFPPKAVLVKESASLVVVETKKLK